MGNSFDSTTWGPGSYMFDFPSVPLVEKVIQANFQKVDNSTNGDKIFVPFMQRWVESANNMIPLDSPQERDLVFQTVYSYLQTLKDFKEKFDNSSRLEKI